MNIWNFDNKEYKLSNGLKVITIKRDTNLCAVNIGIKIGSLYENEKEKGISHFLEHMMFKGTKTRNNEQLNKELEFLGGEYNAYTDNSTTVYSASCICEEIQNAVKLLSDMVMNSVMDEKELEKEKGVVLAEIRSSLDSVEDISFRKLNEFSFNKSALKYDVLGLEKTVKKFNKKQLLDFYKKYYTPDNAIVVIVTPFEHEKSFNMVKNIFNSWSGNVSRKIDIIKEKNNEGVFTTYKRDIEQSTISYLYSLQDIAQEDEMPFKILNHKLGESSNSILFREIRENRGLAYDVYTSIDLSKNIKLMNIFTAVSEEFVDESKIAIDECIDHVKNNIIKFDDETLELMKKIHKTAVLSTLEDSSELCSYVLQQSLEELPINEFINDMNKLDDINKDDINRVANKYLVTPTVHILKPEE